MLADNWAICYSAKSDTIDGHRAVIYRSGKKYFSEHTHVGRLFLKEILWFLSALSSVVCLNHLQVSGAVPFTLA